MRDTDFFKAEEGLGRCYGSSRARNLKGYKILTIIHGASAVPSDQELDVLKVDAQKALLDRLNSILARIRGTEREMNPSLTKISEDNNENCNTDMEREGFNSI